MARKIISASKRFKSISNQKGISLILIVFLLGLIVTGFGVKFLSAGSPQIRNSVKSNQALAEAKAAVIGNVISAQSGTGAGQFPCSEDTSAIGFPPEGQARPSCSNAVVSIGRFAWRTIGTGDIRDGNNDKLWYALSAGFRAAPVNSDSIGGLAIDGLQNQAIAILFSPGSLLTPQSRPMPTSSSPPDVNAYLDGENSDGDVDFITGPSSAAFNDRLVSIQSDDVFPVLEKRVLGEVANYLNAYKLTWGAFPFPAPFSNPSSASYRGSTSISGGLLPIADAGVTWSSGTWKAVRTSNNATTTGACTTVLPYQVLTCSFNLNYNGARTITINANLNNVALGFYKSMSATSASDFQFTPAASMTVSSRTLSYSLDSSGNGKITLQGNSTRRGSYNIVFRRPPQFDDWNTTTAIPNYIFQNNWHHLIYYKIAQPFLPGASFSCGISCLTVNRVDVSPNATQTGIHALLISAGRGLDVTNARPTPTYDASNPAQARAGTLLEDYFDSPNNIANGQVFDSTNRPLTTFNDQIEIVEP
jgi:hypothetical protein